MFRRSSSIFLLQSNHCTLITPDAHLLKFCPKSSSDGDFTASLGVTIAIECTPVSNLSLLQCSLVTFCLSQTETRPFPFSLQQYFALSQAFILPCPQPHSGHELFIVQGVGTCQSSHSLQTPGDSTPTITSFFRL